jgi:dolichyl-phosphate beta-glucosyltransferase
MNPKLSIIIPAYNEVERIGTTLRAVDQYLKKQHMSYEIIVINDGSNDGTVSLLKELAIAIGKLHVVQLQKNEGKGAAVKAGMLLAKGSLRLFMDADNSTSIDQVEKLLPSLDQGYDIAIGSRRIAGAKILVKQNPLREFLGSLFRMVTRFIIPFEYIDTQNGFKLFTAQAAETIFSKLTVRGWSFDVEILVLAKSFGYKVKEVPIIWANDNKSKIKLFHMVKMLRDLFYIREKYVK